MQQKLETHDLTDQQLDEGYWLVTHWTKIQREVTIAIGVLAAIFFIFTITRVVFLYALQADSSEKFVNDLKISLAATQSFPQPELGLGSVIAIPSGASRFDAIFDATNSSDHWLASAQVTFTVNGVDQPTDEVLPFPGGTFPSVLVGCFGGTAQKFTARVGDTDWRRLTASEIALLKERKNISIKDVSFSTHPETGISTSRFTVVNASITSLWEVGLRVILLSAGRSVGVNRATIEKLDTGQERTVEIRWFASLPPVDDIRVVPQVDFLDPRAVRETPSPIQRL